MGTLPICAYAHLRGSPWRWETSIRGGTAFSSWAHNALGLRFWRGFICLCILAGLWLPGPEVSLLLGVGWGRGCVPWL